MIFKVDTYHKYQTFCSSLTLAHISVSLSLDNLSSVYHVTISNIDITPLPTCTASPFRLFLTQFILFSPAISLSHPYPLFCKEHL